MRLYYIIYEIKNFSHTCTCYLVETIASKISPHRQIIFLTTGKNNFSTLSIIFQVNLKYKLKQKKISFAISLINSTIYTTPLA